MEFILKIKLGNDAMQTGEDVAEALRTVALHIEHITDDFSDRERDSPIADQNGNTVGKWRVR